MKTLGGAIRPGCCAYASRFNSWRFRSSAVIGTCAQTGAATISTAVNAAPRMRLVIGTHLPWRGGNHPITYPIVSDRLCGASNCEIAERLLFSGKQMLVPHLRKRPGN